MHAKHLGIKPSIFILILIYLITAVFFTTAFANDDEEIPPYTPIDDIIATDVTAKINGYVIPSYSFNGKLAVIVEDLYQYGFNVNWIQNYKTLIIKRDLNSPFTPVPEVKKENGTKAFDAIYADVTAFVGNRIIPCVSIGNYTAIYFDDLSVFGNVDWDGNTRTADLKLNNAWTYDNDLGFTLVDGYIINNNPYDVKSVWLKTYYYDFAAKQIKSFDENISSGRLYSKSARTYKKILNKDNDFWIGTVLSGVEYLDGNYKINVLAESEGVYLSGDQMFDHITYIASRKVIVLNAKIAELQRKIDIKMKEINDGLEKEYRENNYKPIVIYDSYVGEDIIGTPEAVLTFKNVSGRTIDAIELTFECYDGFGRAVKRYSSGSNSFKGIAQNEVFGYGDTVVYTWKLYGYDLTTKIKNIKITQVHFTNGETWYAK